MIVFVTVVKEYLVLVTPFGVMVFVDVTVAGGSYHGQRDSCGKYSRGLGVCLCLDSGGRRRGLVDVAR